MKAGGRDLQRLARIGPMHIGSSSVPVSILSSLDILPPTDVIMSHTLQGRVRYLESNLSFMRIAFQRSVKQTKYVPFS